MSPGQLDRSTLEGRLARLDRYVSEAEALVSEFSGSQARAIHLAMERALFLCCQCALDIAVHVATARGRSPDGYADALDQLGHLGLLDKEFVEEFRKVAGFRNVLVHGYADLDEEVVRNVALHRLPQFREFAVALRRA